MITRYPILFICVFIFLMPFASLTQAPLDSLKQTLANEMPDSVRLKTLYKIIWPSLPRQADSAQKYADLAMPIARSNADSVAIEKVNFYNGAIQRARGNNDKSLAFFQKYLAYHEMHNNRMEMSRGYFQSGVVNYAKDDLEATAFKITDKLKGIKGKAFVSVNKALVTQASSAIPVIPLYISLLYKIMKDEGVHEGCIEQIQRLFSERMYTGKEVPTDEKGRIRIDDWEMREDIQAKVAELWSQSSTEALDSIGDLKGYRTDFFNLFGFEMEGIDYEAEADEMTQIPGLQEE